MTNITKTNELSVERMTTTLHQLFRHYNETLFNGELPTPAIVIESKGNKKAYGWCSVDKVWKGEEVDVHEIGMASEHINRPFRETATTLLHEIVHLHNGLNGIKDTSRGYTYHNKKFKQQCELHGMEYVTMTEADSKNGWNKPDLTDATWSMIKSWKLDEDAFKLARFDFSEQKKKEKKKTQWRWECPCGTVVRSTKPVVNIACLDCGGKFECTDDE
ncbi:SprT-like domain-containing protein [Priestia megaterium]|uniref:SprT-like domain-containing protein n=1 Tax=Priestia megaterium TaxID=1404 RepID=UPI000BF3CD3D|nr:SprT-like domain-containing protein [Priestia megaterium]PFW43785.1 hypothetical protein COL17_26620 [Priestia megaterium]